MFRRKPKIGSYYSNFSRLHQEPTKNAWRRFLNQLFVLIVFGSIVYFLFLSSYFEVKNIQVNGTKLIAKPNIERLFTKDVNIFLYPVKAIAKKIKENSIVSDVKIYRGLPRSLQVEIFEYEPKLIWQRNQSIGYINNQGVLFYQLREIPKDKNLPQVRELVDGEVNLKDKITTASFVEFCQKIKDEIATMPNITFDHIELGVNSFNVTVKTKENIDILMATDEDADRQLAYLRKILEKRYDKVARKIDVRVPRWGFVE